MTTPLAGIRILDFTRYQQGPFATVMLADMGAEVLKIEEPRGGDFGRRMWREPDGFSAFFESLDRGKKSICIDLRTKEGQQLALRLGASCDVVVQNFRPGTMEAWGLGYGEFRVANPKVIYAEASGWGTKGPMAKYPSFDQISQAYSGFAQHSGGGPGFRPEVPYPGVADQTGGMNLAFGIMTALFARERTGEGQKLEVSLLGTQIALQAPELLHYLHFGEEHARGFRASPTVGHFLCADQRWVMIVGIDQKFWPRIAKALGLEPLVDDPRFARGYARWQNRAELEQVMEEAFLQYSAVEALERLRLADVPASLVQDYAALALEEQPVANDYIVEIEHPRFGKQRVIGLHVQLSGTPGEVSSAAPELGAHTLEVLRSVGVSNDELVALEAGGGIASAG